MAWRFAFEMMNRENERFVQVFDAVLNLSSTISNSDTLFVLFSWRWKKLNSTNSSYQNEEKEKTTFILNFSIPIGVNLEAKNIVLLFWVLFCFYRTSLIMSSSSSWVKRSPMFNMILKGKESCSKEKREEDFLYSNLF